MDISKINKAVDILYNSRINFKRIFKNYQKIAHPISFQEAYAIQDELVKKYLSDKNNLINWKK